MTQVTFTGCSDILRDSDGLAYSPPHWQTNEADHTVVSWPVLYVSGTNVQTVTTFANHALSQATVGGEFPLVIKGVVRGGGTSFTLWGTNADPYILRDDCPVSTCADHPLTPGTVDYYKPMTIHWFYGYANEPDYLDAGVTTNHVYVSLRTPTNGVALYHTVVHLACSTTGATTPTDAAMNTWSFFPEPGNVRTWNGLPLSYYMSGVAWANGITTLDGLLAARNGQCGSWRELLEMAWAVNGVASQMATVLTLDSPGNHIFLVKNWALGSPTLSNDPPYNYLFLLDSSNGSMVGVGNYGDLANQPGVAGQNSSTAAEKAFGFHFIQLLNGVYYDPSYGKTYTGAADFQARAISGYGKLNPVQDVPGRFKFGVKPCTSTVEIQIVP